MKKFFQIISITIVAGIFAHYTALDFGSIYNNLFPNTLGGSWVGSKESSLYLAGIDAAYLFFICLFIISFFKSTWGYLVLGVLTLPAVVYVFFLDPKHFYFPVVFALVGFILGIIFFKLREKFYPVKVDQKTA